MDFIAIAASCINEDFSREVFVASMIPMPPGGHSAENIKKAIELMINKFKFDKELIRSKLNLLNKAYIF